MRIFPPFPAVEPLTDNSSRDLALDSVRAWSLIVVVFGHFIMQIYLWEDGIPLSGNTLSSGNLWPFATWILQVMPLFFVAGGAVNIGSYLRSSGNFNQWLWQRTRRLMKPTVVFLLTLAVIFSVITLVADERITDGLVSGVTGPLWFLSVYILVVALTPVSVKIWNLLGLKSIWVFFVLAVLIDYIRLNIADVAGVLNLIVIWVMVHQLGYWYQQGVSRTHAQVLIVIGLLSNVVLTQVLKWYPTSLVGIPTEKFSNMAPPTIILALHSFVLFGIFVLISPWLRKVSSTPQGFRLMSRAAMLAMTIYLWHMAVLVSWLTGLHYLGFDLPARIENSTIVPDGIQYWIWLIPSTLGFGLVLYAIVRMLWPIEFMKIRWFDNPNVKISHSALRASFGTALISLGLLAIAGAGFSGFPLAIRESFGIPISSLGALLAIGLGLTLLRQKAYSG